MKSISVAHVLLTICFCACSNKKEDILKSGIEHFYNHEWRKTIDKLGSLANSNNDVAQYYVAISCFNLGDSSQSNYYLTLSAKQGYYRSASLIGNQYRYGTDGKPRNDSLANYWYSVGCDRLERDLKNNLPDAKAGIALRYDWGCGVVQDEQKVVNYMRRRQMDI